MAYMRSARSGAPPGPPLGSGGGRFTSPRAGSVLSPWGVLHHDDCENKEQETSVVNLAAAGFVLGRVPFFLLGRVAAVAVAWMVVPRASTPPAARMVAL